MQKIILIILSILIITWCNQKEPMNDKNPINTWNIITWEQTNLTWDIENLTWENIIVKENQENVDEVMKVVDELLNE